MGITIIKHERSKLIERFQQMKRDRIPIIGGGAGTGISAKGEEAGGIDLIVIYNSGRYRMAGRGSAAGLLAYGNANEVVLEMAMEILPVVKRTPVLAGVNQVIDLLDQSLGHTRSHLLYIRRIIIYRLLQILNAQLHRRQRILDLMRHLPRHFPPGVNSLPQTKAALVSPPRAAYSHSASVGSR